MTQQGLGIEPIENDFKPLECPEHGFTSIERSAEHGFTSSGRSAEHGFTLAEVIIALFIFAMLAATGVALLDFSVRAQAAGASRLDVIASERRLSGLLASDLGQVVQRTARDTNGASVRAFSGRRGGGDGPLLSYVRGGWSNPDDAPRPNIQRVEIVMKEGRLERQAYARTDGGRAGNATLLAEGLKNVRARYRGPSGWQDDWNDANPLAVPRAVELTLVLQKGAPLTLDFLVGGGQ